jgi:hypothetical protein
VKLSFIITHFVLKMHTVSIWGSAQVKSELPENSKCQGDLHSQEAFPQLLHRFLFSRLAWALPRIRAGSATIFSVIEYFCIVNIGHLDPTREHLLIM